jgi:hypothetical protein
MPIDLEITNVAINESPTGSLTIGDDYVETNAITFNITLRGNGSVWLTMQIPVGEDGVLRQPEDMNDLVVETPTTDPKPKLRDGKWLLGDYARGIQVSGSTELSVSIRNILCRASEEDSEITITAATETSQELKETLPIKKAKPTEAPKNPILYFIAEPTYLIGSGEVKLRWAVAGDEGDVTLDTPTQKNWNPNASSTTDSPSTTFAYTLRVKGKQRQATVNVLQKGWHEIYPLGKPDANGSGSFPSVIFDAAGRTDGTTGAALYAIFVRGPDRKAVLCKSADGITGWQIIDKAVPEGMESSPGVQLGNRLWLIGGSAVDWDNISKRICYYDLDRGSGWQDASVTGFDDGARMGHACVIVDDNTIWVLGGLGKYHECRNDVWSLAVDGGAVSATLMPETPPVPQTPPVPETPHVPETPPVPKKPDIWSRRCMFSAFKYKDMIWVCGGVSKPYGNPLGDLWYSSKSPVSWKKSEGGPDGLENAIGIGAASITSRLFTIFMTRERKNGSWSQRARMSRLNELTTTGPTWYEFDQPGFQIRDDLWSEWTSNPHSIGVVGFQGRLYLRYLHREALHSPNVVSAPLYVYVDS